MVGIARTSGKNRTAGAEVLGGIALEGQRGSDSATLAASKEPGGCSSATSDCGKWQYLTEVDIVHVGNGQRSLWRLGDNQGDVLGVGLEVDAVCNACANHTVSSANNSHNT